MERNKRIDIDNEEALSTCKALASPLRLEILKLLSKTSLSVKEIATALNVPFTTAATNINILEEANLINVINKPGKHGTIKLCFLASEEVSLRFVAREVTKRKTEEKYSVPVGSYQEFDVKPTCGISGKKDFLGKDDDPNTFYSPLRIYAEILWFTTGYVKYIIPLKDNKNISEIEISLELCSEAQNHREDYKSDITFLVNDVNIGTYTSPGDFGGKRGKYTPSYWPISASQYGLLKTIKIDKKRTSIDSASMSSVTIDDLHLEEQNCLSLTIKVDENANNPGGVNLFGSNFGNYPINIEIKVAH